ncbi:PREDICTED: aspartic proteinase-like protein 1 isoform X1 [Tarenaya hassleriana]|uniref:aspartic proteinase-like protein 1 isoform X1 n=1 Tax=Tarenaya hassleriana TaxID=28532 RepID=UPI00053C0EA0|nr:PREDICTED: aspartic proteinase-like protein 1 isoform X1 [Tarenaya hassleriana]
MASFASVLAIAVCLFADVSALGFTFSAKLIHRYSLEAAEWRSREGVVVFPERKSLEYAEVLLSSDLKRLRMKFGSRLQFLFPSEGSLIQSFGNELGWLHYTWIDVGNPNVPFLVALDAGSDLFWVPCECIRCASFSASQYHVLDRDLSEYHPSKSSTVQNVSCSHNLCQARDNCKNPEDLCPYIVEYDTDDTSTSGYLVQEKLHLASLGEGTSRNGVQASVIMGCGRKQSGIFLSGAAPDGLIGLGPGNISIPTILANAGLIRNSFSICYDEDDSGRFLFGDQGPQSQQYTPLLTKDGKYEAYIVRVESCCVGTTCIKQSGYRANVDTGSSFTSLPKDVHDKVVAELDKRLDIKRTGQQGIFDNCYRASSKDLAKFPTIRLMFTNNQSFSVGDYTISSGTVICTNPFPNRYFLRALYV